MNNADKLLREISEYKFLILELHIYLNSHPYDEKIAKELDEYSTKVNKLMQEFEEKFGPIMQTSMKANRWAWIANPWPWENEEA